MSPCSNGRRNRQDSLLPSCRARDDVASLNQWNRRQRKRRDKSAVSQRVYTGRGVALSQNDLACRGVEHTLRKWSVKTLLGDALVGDLVDPYDFAGPVARVISRHRRCPGPGIRSFGVDEVTRQAHEFPRLDAVQSLFDLFAARNHVHVRAMQGDLV